MSDALHKIDDLLSLPDAVMLEVQAVLKDYYGVLATMLQCVEIVQSNKLLAADLYASGGAGDTSTREDIIDALSVKLLGRYRCWPTNGDREEVQRKFYADFSTAALAAGYGLASDSFLDSVATP